MTSTQSIEPTDTASAVAIPAVNSHNGWSLLEEVIVGEPNHLTYHDDISFRLFYCQNLDSVDQADGARPWLSAGDSADERRLRDEMAEDLDGFIDLLRAEGVVVRTPDPRPRADAVQSPEWSTTSGHSIMPRDLFIVIGSELIETAPLLRSRYFEGDLYKALFTEYFAAGAKWTVAPRSRLRADNFDYGFALSQGYAGPVPASRCYEPMFDGAQLVRLGRDILFNCSTENHRMGLRWLARQLGDDYALHEIGITDNHVDTRVVPLRPGTLLLHEQVTASQLPPFLRGWDVVRFSPPADTLDRSRYGRRLVLSAPSLGMNVFSLDEERVVVQHDQHQLMSDLVAAGLRPLPCRWRHGRLIGGGFHCMTLDVRRQSSLERYS